MNGFHRVITSFLVVLLVSTGTGYGIPTLSSEMYTQQLQITFTDASSASQAVLSICPLYHGYEWTVSARWDDNSPTDIRMMGVMDAYGIRATFFMNGRDQGYWGPRYDYTGPNTDIDKLLVASGKHSIGGHGWRHPSLGYLNRNRIWAEVMRVRADREASSDTTLCCYSMSNINWSNDLEGTQIAPVIAEAFFRAGFYFNANANFPAAAGVTMPAANLLPWDGATVESVSTAFEQYLQNQSMQQQNPNISFAMHAPAHNTEALWQALETKLSLYYGRPEWWYCNQNQYAAYRMQYMLGSVQSQLDGNILSVELTRPLLAELNDSTPLTLKLEGVEPNDIVSATSATATVELLDSNDPVMLDVFHDSNQTLPVSIGWIHYDGISAPVVMDTEFDYIYGRLDADGNDLDLTLLNTSDQPLENIRVVFRGTLRWEEARQVVLADDLDPDEQVVVSITAPTLNEGFEYTCGPEFYAAQVDCTEGGTPIRCHFTFTTDTGAEDPSYPVGRCVVAGPISASLYSYELAEEAARGGLGNLHLSDGSQRSWFSTETMPNFLSCEGVYALAPAAEQNLTDYYMVSTTVNSSTTQLAAVEPAARVIDIFVNGLAVNPESFELRSGKNSLMVAYNADKKRAVMLRLASAPTGERLQTISYSTPDADDPVAVFTTDKDDGYAPLTVDFDASASIAGAAPIVSYDWDFADGNFATGVTTSHTFLHDGDYNVMLTVTDADSRTSITQRLIHVGSIDVSDIGDLYEDGRIDFLDFAVLAEYWLTDEPTVDIITDGAIDNRDLSVIVDNWMFGVPVPHQAPVAYYMLDGNANDSSGFDHHGTILGNPTWAAGFDATANGALYFDGSGDVINCGTFNPSQVTGMLTIACWVNWPGTTGSGQQMIAKRSSWADNMMWQITIKDDNLIQFANGNTGGDWSIANFGVAMPQNTWTHLAITYNGTDATLYINGQNPVSVPYTMGLGTGAIFSIGSSYQSGTPGAFFRGTLDEVRLYDRPLSQSEIQQLATAP